MKINRKIKIFQSLGNRSTLLIPDFLFPFFEEARLKEGNTKSLLSLLLKRFYENKTRLILKNEIGATIEYQEEELSLNRIDFRPIKSDWVKLKLLAGSHNLSMCAFFVLLLKLYVAGAFNYKKEGVPPKFPKITLHQSITLYSIPQFTRLLHLRT